MKKILFFTATLFFLHAALCQQTAKLEELMDVYTRQYKFNGSVLVVHKGKIILDKGYGLRNAADSSRNDQNSIFQIGSITKQFTATVLLKLQEEKKLSLKNKLSQYFPGYPKGDSITLEHLLTHTSGIYSYTDDQSFMTNEVAKPASREKMMALFKNKPLLFSPGSQWSYSNSAYSLLGYIIEDVTKMPYEQVVRNYIFKKAGMGHSGFAFTLLTNPDKATGYFRLKEDGNTPAPVVDSSVSYSAGSIYSTTGDLYNWFLAMQRNSIISLASKTIAYTPVLNKYGYGWVTDSIAGQKTIGHSGGIFGFTSNMVSVPGDSTTVILLANIGTPHLFTITNSIYAILYNQPYELPRERTAIVLPAEILEQYTGVFELLPELVIKVSVEDGKLIAKPEGQEALQLHPEKTDLFFLKEIDAQIKFTRNEKNEVIAMTLYQGGKEMTGKKR
ncbi:MAG: serine hydrolase [Ferruginibacter sp.]|nr:serine hydrolase [Chitinophagaceae bacterium]